MVSDIDDGTPLGIPSARRFAIRGTPGPTVERPTAQPASDRMEFGDRAPRLTPRGAPATTPARPDRPIGLKNEHLPRPWTVRRVFGMIFLPKR